MGEAVEIIPFPRVGIFRHHQLVCHRVALEFPELNGRSERHTIPRQPVEIHQRDLRHPRLQEADLRLDQPLSFFGGVVLRVLPQISVLASLLDLFWEVMFELTVKSVNLVLEPLQEPGLHRKASLAHLISSSGLSTITIGPLVEHM